jgi:hypothetical protein
MRSLVGVSAVMLILAGCGEGQSSKQDQPGGWLGQQDARELVSEKSCAGPFISDLKPIEHIHSHSTELLLQGRNKAFQDQVGNDTCNELSRYLSASTWAEQGRPVANDIRLLIDFGQHADNKEKSTIKINSAKLYFLDGSLSENMAKLEIRCLSPFHLQCLAAEEGSIACSDYKINYESQTCTFHGDVILVSYANHQRSDLQITGEISFSSDGTTSIKVNKAGWMVMR